MLEVFQTISSFLLDNVLTSAVFWFWGVIIAFVLFVKYGHRRRWRWAVYLRWYLAHCDWTEEQVERYLSESKRRP